LQSPGRTQLYDRIDRRVEEMFRRGLVAEVQTLIARYPRDCHSFKAIGYRQVARYLDGSWTLEQAIEDTQRESRRYAKRQATWFRSDPSIVWLDAAAASDQIAEQAWVSVARFLE
jgi:tRNA dimethylallyltransferase